MSISCYKVIPNNVYPCQGGGTHNGKGYKVVDPIQPGTQHTLQQQTGVSVYSARKTDIANLLVRLVVCQKQ